MNLRRFVIYTVFAGLLASFGIYLHWRTPHISLAALPYLQAETYQERKAYRVDPYIAAAQKLQAMGPTAACNQLLLLSRSEDTDDGQKIAVLCRMLFVKRPGGEFRRAMIGSAAFIGSTNELDWPLEPIEIIDGIPFLITWGYSIHGAPEEPQEYVRYCMNNCNWSEFRFAAKTETEKKAALAKLFASPKCQKNLAGDGRDFLTAQIN